MKYIISYCIAVLLTILLAGCTETTKIGPETPEGPAYVEVSSDKLIFDADGGSVSIVVATNAAAWDYTSTGDWFIVTRKEDNTLAVETSINAGPETLTGSIVVSGEKNGDQVSATVSLVQRAERSINLSAEGTSNCYIAHTGKAYKFDASVKGNGKGYTTVGQRNKVLIYCGIVSFVLLLIIYGSLLYMGACVSGDYAQNIGRAELLVAIIQRVGTWVMVPMGIAVVLACLTTAIGQIAAVAEFTSSATGNRISYKQVAIVCCILSALTALLGVDGIVTYIGWIFGVCSPPCLALLVLGIIGRFMPNNGAYKGSVYLVTLFALLESLPGLSSLGFAKAIVAATPLSTYGFGWIVPFIIGLIGGSIIGHFVSASEPVEAEA